MTSQLRARTARRGVRVAAVTALTGLLAGGLTLGTQVAANAAPVLVTTTLTNSAGQAIDGFVSATPAGAGTAAFQDITDGVVSLQLEPGTYKLRFSAASSLYAAEYYNDKADFATADAVTVAGPTSLAPVSLASLPVFSGKLVNALGRPVQGGSVEIRTTAGSFVKSDDVRADGSFAVGAPAGTYKVAFFGDGYVTEYYNNKIDAATADPVALGAGGTDLGTVSLSKGSVVTGRILNAVGAPLERARATVYVNGSSFSDYADAAGVYRIENVPPGTGKVQFDDPVGEYLGEWYADKTSQATADPVAIPMDGTATVPDVQLANDPAAVVNPAAVDIAGTVVDSAGKPVIGARVSAYDTPASGRSESFVDSVRTNRVGQFFFTHLAPDNSETAYKLFASDINDRETGQYYRLSRWSGGSQSIKLAAPVPVPSGGNVISLPLTGGVGGTVTSESGLPVDGVYAEFFGLNDNAFSGSAAVKLDGTYLTTRLEPGQYKVLFSDTGSYVGDRYRMHAPEWYNDAVFKTAKVITVSSGATVGGINAALNEMLQVKRAPEILGKPYLKGTVRAYPGVWSVMDGTTFTYEWLANGTVVATGSRFTIPKSLKNKRLQLRVTAENGNMTGQAIVGSWGKLKLKPKVKIKVSGKNASVTISSKKVTSSKIRGRVVAKVVKRLDDFGAPVYKVAGKAKIKAGHARLTLKKLKPGKNKVVFFVKLKGKLGNAVKAKKVKLS